jgi:hypothetical protein
MILRVLVLATLGGCSARALSVADGAAEPKGTTIGYDAGVRDAPPVVVPDVVVWTDSVVTLWDGGVRPFEARYESSDSFGGHDSVLVDEDRRVHVDNCTGTIPEADYAALWSLLEAADFFNLEPNNDGCDYVAAQMSLTVRLGDLVHGIAFMRCPGVPRPLIDLIDAVIDTSRFATDC